jgi:hypothetical protein
MKRNTRKTKEYEEYKNVLCQLQEPYEPADDVTAM